MKRCFLGIDTSNYTTSLAVASEDGEITANWKAPLPVAAGERGLRQSDAVFAHVRNLPDLFAQLQPLLHQTAGDPLQVAAVGCSVAPRRGEDSYMPCFLTGKAVASALSAALGVPLYSFSHQEGHIMAALYAAGAIDTLADAPFAAFHVSGGTTDMMLVEPDDGRFSIRCVGTSLDLHAGQAIDRIGVAMGEPFPAGPALERLAATYHGKIPKPRICVQGLDCHLSGLENLALKLLKDTDDRALVAAYTLQFIENTLAAMLQALRNTYGVMPVIFAGGVMSNARLRKGLSVYPQTYFSEPAFSADNAAGAALLCRRQFFANTVYDK